ncbi:MAG: hypothetical protein GTO24_20145 [candidate division Zixibacteria bacterium]|nr:hypothetical protein [candidate division Zixibacteria bacterium]
MMAAMVLFPVGCSKLLPTAPVEVETQGFQTEELWPAPPANLAPRLQSCAESVSGWFSLSGGELTVEGECLNLSFYVPKQALSNKIYISMNASLFYYYGDKVVLKGLLLGFRPDGVVFSRPAIIKLEASVLEAAAGDVLILYWFNPKTLLWEVQQEVEVDGEEVEFKIYDFSRYAIS